MAKLADAQDLKSCDLLGRAGSIPALGTQLCEYGCLFFETGFCVYFGLSHCHVLEDEMTEEIDGLVEQYEARKLTRRQLVTSLVAIAAAAPRMAAAQSVGQVAQGLTINHVSLAVSDVEASAEFYQALLGLEVVSRPPNGGINMGLSDGFLGVYNIPDPGRVHHFCIGVDDFDADRVKERFDEVGYEARVNRNPAARTTGGDQLYFSDPDGTLVQLGHNGYQG